MNGKEFVWIELLAKWFKAYCSDKNIADHQSNFKNAKDALIPDCQISEVRMKFGLELPKKM